MPINSSIPKNANSAGLKQFMYGYSWAPALLLFLLIRVPTGNPAKISELSMIILFVQNVHEHLNL
jgi:hypothetical protein